VTGGPFSIPNRVVFANFGKPATGAADELEYVYMGNGSETMRRWDGSAFTSPANMPKGCPYLYPRSSRLVATCFDAGSHILGPTAGPSSQSHVYFSDPGAPETWTANNYVILTPGDGERIHGAAAWRDLFFVFKRSKFFVFTGESTGGDGNPIFNYRTVDTGVGLSGYSAGMEAAGAITSGPDGVYFMNERGVWRTSGDAPVLISGRIAPFFDGTASTSITTSTTRMREARMTWHDDRLWISVATGSSTHNDRVLVYDPALDAWMVHDLSAYGMASFRSSAAREDLMFAYSTGTNDIGNHSPVSTTDNGTAITSRWQSGFYDLGEPGRTVYTRWTRVWGSGAPTVSVFTDHVSTDTRAAAVTLGTAPAVSEGYHQQSYKGELFSHKLSGTTAWSVSRLQHDVAFVRG
jgi:hypothetical protein